MSPLIYILFCLSVGCNGIGIEIKYSSTLPNWVNASSLQELPNTRYVDGNLRLLIEPHYIISMEQITYRDGDLEQITSFFNFRNLGFVSMINNGQKMLPNFRNLPKLDKVQIKECEITLIESNLLSNTPVKILDLQKNRIKEIENGSFGKKVHSLDLKCNQLTSISAAWFKNATNLEWLSLESNKISTLEPNLFAKFKKLVQLHLSRNEIVTLGDGCLSGPTQFHVLDLGTNDISDIKPNVFSSTHVNINNLRISFNRLSFINQEVMNKVSVNNCSVIFGNPWQCPCVTSIREWLHPSNVKALLSGEASCIFTEDNSKECIPLINNELFNTYISSFSAVDRRICNYLAENIIDNKNETFWIWGEIDLR